MRTCPECGETVPHPAGSCGACGADLRRGRPLRGYLASALALVAIIAAAALLHSYLQKRVIRPPADFLPSSASAVISLDVRRDSAAGRALQTSWPADDRRILAERATELAQRIIDWTALPLDVREEAARWFDGELLAASIGEPEGRAFGPRSFVLIARVTDGRRARGDLDSSAADLAREVGWERSVLRSDGRAIVVWGEPDRRSEISYAAQDGCLIVSANSELVDLCLRTAAEPERRLSAKREFAQTCGSLPDEAFLWCYARAPELVQTVRSFLPALRHGWMGLARAYLGRRGPPWTSDTTARSLSSLGHIGLAVTPETNGVRVHANYWREPRGQIAGPAPDLARLGDLIPRDAAAFVLVRGLPSLLSSLLPARSSAREQRARRPGLLEDDLRALLAAEHIPETLLVMLLPRANEDRPQVVAAAFAGPGAEETARRLGETIPRAAVGEIKGAHVLATDREGLGEVERAARDRGSRLDVRIDPHARLQAWAQPAQVSPALDRLDEIDLSARDNASGGRGNLYVKAEPRYLLGGD